MWSAKRLDHSQNVLLFKFRDNRKEAQFLNPFSSNGSAFSQLEENVFHIRLISVCSAENVPPLKTSIAYD